MTAQQQLENAVRKVNSIKDGSAALLITTNTDRIDVKLQGPHQTFSYTAMNMHPFNGIEHCCKNILDTILFTSLVGPPLGAVNSEGKPLS